MRAISTSNITSVISLILLLLVVCAPYAFAQFSPPGTQENIIEFDPLYPKPLQEFSVRINDLTGDYTANPTTWYINGKERSDLSGGINATLTAPPLGEHMDIVIVAHTKSGNKRTEAAFVSSDIDIIVEGDTLAPHFYKGRHLPGTGSRIHVSAIPHIFDTNGKKLNPDELVFRWSLNDKIIDSGVGKQAISVAIPEFADAVLRLSLEGVNTGVAYRTLMFVDFVEPIVRFYEHSPLSGLSPNAISSIETEQDEISVRAEPYYVSRDVYSNARTRWTLNGEVVEYAGEDNQMITLGDGVGLSEVGYSLQNLSTLLQSVSSLFFVNFLEE